MTTRGKATGKSERFVVLNRAEQEALYGLPDFDDLQRLEFLALSCNCQGLHAQIYCILQIAKKPNICFSASDGMMLRTTATLF